MGGGGGKGGGFNPLDVIIPLVTDAVVAVAAPEALPFVVGGQAAGAGIGGAVGGGQGAAIGSKIGGTAGGLGSGFSGGPGFGAATDATSLTTTLPEGQAALTPPSSTLDSSLTFGGTGGGLNFGPGTSLAATLPAGQAALDASMPGGSSGLNFGLPSSLPSGGGAGGLRGSGAAMLGQQLSGALGGLFGLGGSGLGGTGQLPLSIPQGGAVPGGVTPAQLSAIQSEKHQGLAPWYINRMRGGSIGPGISGVDPNQMALMMMQANPSLFT